MIYTLDEIREKIAPVLEKYHVQKVIIFGSYALGLANGNSDIDLIYQREGSLVKGLIKMTEFKEELEAVLQKKVDIIPKESMGTPIFKRRYPKFISNVDDSGILLYG